MSTTITITSVNDKNQIWAEAYEFAECNSDRHENPSGDYHGHLTIEANRTPFNTFDEAEKYLEKTYNENYCDGAVPYYEIEDPDEMKKTKTLLNLEERVMKNRADKKAYIEETSVKNLKSKLISCSKCGSKIAKDYLHCNYCPVCSNDLRAKYVLDRIEKYDTDFNKINKQLKARKSEEIKRHIKKNKKAANVCWAIKLSVRG